MGELGSLLSNRLALTKQSKNCVKYDVGFSSATEENNTISIYLYMINLY